MLQKTGRIPFLSQVLKIKILLVSPKRTSDFVPVFLFFFFYGCSCCRTLHFHVPDLKIFLVQIVFSNFQGIKRRRGFEEGVAAAFPTVQECVS